MPKDPNIIRSRKNFFNTFIRCVGFVIILPIFCAFFISCGGNQPELLTTEYTFGPDDYSAIYPTTNVAKDGADKNVGKILILSDGESWRGRSVSSVANNLIFPAHTVTGGKGDGNGTFLDGLTIDNPVDSAACVAIGYKFRNSRAVTQ